MERMEWSQIAFAFALVCAAIPPLSLFYSLKPAGTYEGVPYTLAAKKGGKGPRFVSLGMPLPCGVPFELESEGVMERVGARVGLFKEQQTGDAEFDAAVYISCDRPTLGRLLASRPEARRIILEILRSGARRVFCDGREIRVVRMHQTEPSPPDFPRLLELRAQLLPLVRAFEASGAEGLPVRLLALQSFCCFVGIYAIGSAIPWMGFLPTRILERAALAPPAAVMGVAATLICGMVFASLARTGRTARQALPWMVMFLCGVGPASYQASVEINTRLDRAEPATLRCEVAKVEEFRRASVWDNRVTLGPCQHAVGDAPSESLVAPAALTLDYKPFSQVEEGGELLLILSPGALDAAWVRDARPI